MDPMSRNVLVWGCSILVTLLTMPIAGCAGRGDVIPVNLTAKSKDGSTNVAAGRPSNGPRISVVAFEDARSDRTKIGSRSSLWGSETAFNVPSGSVGEETAQAFTDYLKRKGWPAQYTKSIPSSDGDRPDIVLSGKILDLSLDAKGGFGSTDVNAKSKLAIQANNKADDSSITDTVSHSGTYSVFWFEPKDGEDILSEVLEKNFERFVLNTKFEDGSLRFR